jgi:hypothetical protein
MATVKEDKIIAALALIGIATILASVIAVTIRWIDPFFSFDSQGHPTIFGRMFVYGIYFAESLAVMLVAWLAWLAFWSFIPRRTVKVRHIRNIPIKAT